MTERSVDGQRSITTPRFDAVQNMLVFNRLESGDRQLADDLVRSLRTLYRKKGYPVPPLITTKPVEPVPEEFKRWFEKIPEAMIRLDELMGLEKGEPLSPKAQNFFENDWRAGRTAILMLMNAQEIAQSLQETSV
jgi:hypothetical protein